MTNSGAQNNTSKSNVTNNNNAPALATPLAIVGIGCLFPQAENKDSYWANIKGGVDSISDIPESHWRVADHYDPDPKRPDHTYGKRGGFLDPIEFNPLEFSIQPNILEAIDTSQLLGLIAAREALKDAGYDPAGDFARDRVSVLLGVTGALEMVIPLGARLGHPAWRKALKGAGVPDDVAQDVVERIADSYVPWQENSFPGLLGNVVAGRISKQFDLGGTNSVIDAACGSSLSAVHMAAMELSCGRSDMVITGGVDTFNDIFMYTCFSKTPALSPSNIIRPFDSHSDGTLIGEGLGLVVLKRLEDAERDNDKIYAVIRGIGTASDGKKGAIYEPSADGQKRTLCDAYQQAGIDPKTISLIEAHGTGTKVGDATEISALRDVYGESDGTPWCALGSVKSQIGHTKASAGSAGLIKTALALHNKVLPPTINVDQPQDVITMGNSPFYVNTKIRPWLSNPDHPRRAAVSAFGFGGSNFHCVLEEHETESNSCDWSTAPQIIALSGTDKNSLQRQLEQIPTDITAAKFKRFAAQSRADFNSTDSQRILFVVESAKELNATVANAKKLLTSDKTLASTPTGIWYGNNAQQGKLAVLFPGQGAQYPQMLVDLACHAPQFLNTLNTAHNTLETEKGLNQLIYPHSVYSDHDQSVAIKKLQATQVAQPAIGAVSLGAWNYIKNYGITASAWGGHSYGELTALCAAGCYSSEDLFRLSQLRGELMAGDGSDKGTMLAVSSSLAKIEQLLAEEKLDLVLANRNTPSQGVLSGSRSEIERATQLCKERGLRCVALDVAAAFHSKLVASASEPFLAALNDVEVKPADAPVYANKTAAPYPDNGDAIRSLLAEQIASPVEFVQQVEQMYASGITTFVEVGPGARLTGMAGKILKGKGAQAIALDSSNGKRSGLNDLARLLIQLSAMGYPIQLQNWDSEYALRELGQPESPAPRMTVTLTGANYRKKAPERPDSKRNLVDANTLPKPVAQVTAAPTPVATQTASSDSLRALQDNMLVLQRMQEDTAKLHNQFLEGQAAAVQTMRSLMDHQMGVATPTSIALPTTTSVAPAPAVTMIQQKVIVQPVKAPVVPTVQTVNTNVSATLLEVVAEKTGYPQEMLELDMSLDADLGIDSIKRVEILSAIQEKLPELPALQPEQLGSLQTLRQIVEAMGSVAVTTTAVTASAGASTGADVSLTLLEVVAEKTGYPQEMLELDMSLDADLGIDSIKRVEILSAIQEKLPELPALQPEQLSSLQTLRQIVEAMGSVAVTTTAVSASAVASTGADVSLTLLEVVAEKTGYPQEMLELDMSLDADLGIDSIKRVEILSAIQEKLPELPALQPEQLGSLQTLRQIVEAMGSVPVAATAVTASIVSAASTDVSATLLEVVAEKTGYPQEMLELDMSLDADLGIDSVKRVEILSAIQEKLPELPALQPEQLGSLQTLRQIVEAMEVKSSSTESNTAQTETAILAPAQSSEAKLHRQVISLQEVETHRASVSLHKKAPIWVVDDCSSLSIEVVNQLNLRGFKAELVSPSHSVTPESLTALVVLSPQFGTDSQFISDAFSLVQRCASALKDNSSSADSCLMTVSHLDGMCGFNRQSPIIDPLSGGLAGISKTAHHEWPEVYCKALDLGVDLDDNQQVEAIIEELLCVGPVEVAANKSGRMTLVLQQQDLPQADSSLNLSTDDIIVISGGARGVTAEVAHSLAQSGQPTLLLLGRSELPDAEPVWLCAAKSEAEVKKAIMAHADQPLKPRQLNDACQSALNNRELLENIQRLEATGSKVLYRSVDIRDEQAVNEIIQQVRELGTIRGIIHGAGVLADRMIEDKTLEQFDLVYSTKIAGLQALLQATHTDPLTFIALFSSSTGRFGRTGQVDYAVANEVLNKTAQALARQRQDCRIVSINWGPWDGGMVTPALKKIFAAEGIDVIDLQCGADYLLKELAHCDEDVEVVILGGEGDPANTKPTETAEVTHEDAPSQLGTSVYNLNVNINSMPFLEDHVINGKAVVPMAILIEWLAQGALHNQPGLIFHGFNNLRVKKGLLLDHKTTVEAELRCGSVENSDGQFIIPMSICNAADGSVYASTDIVLTNTLPPQRPNMEPLVIDGGEINSKDEIYSSGKLFHGPSLQGLTHVVGNNIEGIIALSNIAPMPSKWMNNPLRNQWLADPQALDSSFQMMILWSFSQKNLGSLPSFVAEYRQYCEQFPVGTTRIQCRVTKVNNHSATANIDFIDGQSRQLIARINGYECTMTEGLQQAFYNNKLHK